MNRLTPGYIAPNTRYTPPVNNNNRSVESSNAGTTTPAASVGAVNIQIYNPSVNPNNVSYPVNNNNTTMSQPIKQQKSIDPAPTQQPAAAAIKTQEKKDVKKDEKDKTAVPLTDDYIKTLENYLNNESPEVREMGVKELFARYKERDDRKDNPSLAGLLNIALQDSSQKVKTHALLTIESGYAYGDSETVEILKNMQAKSNDKYNTDALAASNALLQLSGKKMNLSTENVAASQSIEEKPKVGQKLDLMAG